MSIIMGFQAVIKRFENGEKKVSLSAETDQYHMAKFILIDLAHPMVIDMT